ncbi:hypothetical protein H312_01371 [Anncaliia algerae PRA339]|uniref:Uncharacterized protein n=1 Tax=Anncaliia algerae PRA339 TaxID=1288291 RepID=A0A059F211_9MICR|nr:hypothetical protein H312_01371 [Anncaliia algerae PRA339]
MIIICTIYLSDAKTAISAWVNALFIAIVLHIDLPAFKSILFIFARVALSSYKQISIIHGTYICNTKNSSFYLMFHCLTSNIYFILIYLFYLFSAKYVWVLFLFCNYFQKCVFGI